MPLKFQPLRLCLTLSLVILSLCLTLSSSIAAEKEKTLNVYGWTDFIAPDTLPNFTKQTGIKINYDVVDSSDMMVAKIISGKSGYDVFFPTSNPSLVRLIETGALHKLDRSKIPNWKNLDQDMMKQIQKFDPGNEHTVIYQYVVTGMGVNKKKVKELFPDAPLDSLDLIMKPEYISKIKDCGIVMLEGSIDIFPIILNYLGYSTGTTDPKELKVLEDRLMAIRPYIKYFHSSSYINDLASGDVCVALGFSGDVNQAKARSKEIGSDVEIEFILPKEGAEIGFDLIAIPQDADNIEDAYKFINYILEPKVMADISTYILYPNAIPASKAYIAPEILADRSIFLSPEDQKKTFIPELLSKIDLRQRNRIWTKFVYNR